MSLLFNSNFASRPVFRERKPVVGEGLLYV
jgi:hypothetical protein